MERRVKKEGKLIEKREIDVERMKRREIRNGRQ